MIDPGLSPIDQVGYTDVLGVPISAVSMDMTVATVARWVVEGGSHIICPTTVAGVMEARRRPLLMSILRNADLVVADGRPMVWLSHLRGQRHVDQVYGPDLMLAVCDFGLAHGYRHYFYGGDPGVAEQLAGRLEDRFPGLVVVGCHTPPFRPLSAAEDREIVDLINEAEPDIVWVGLGESKQDQWVADHAGRLTAPVLIGVGAAFDFLSGVKRQAPAWARKIGLEMAFRAITEPRRLGPRFLRNHPRFAALAAWQLIRQRRHLATGLRPLR